MFPISKDVLHAAHFPLHLPLKITVQFETEENGQNEFVSHMDRSEVKL